MRGLSRRAQIYICSVLGLGGFLLLWQGAGIWMLGGKVVVAPAKNKRLCIRHES